MCIQDIEQTYESTLKGKYFLITTQTDYIKLLTEANEMIKYIYPERIIKTLQHVKPKKYHTNHPHQRIYLCKNTHDLSRVQPSPSTIFTKKSEGSIKRQFHL